MNKYKYQRDFHVNQLRILRRKEKRGENIDVSMIQELEKQIQAHDQTLSKIIEMMVKKLSKATLDNDWTNKFKRFCDNVNFDFDQILLFMGGPLWENENLKRQLKEKGHHIITSSKLRYDIDASVALSSTLGSIGGAHFNSLTKK